MQDNYNIDDLFRKAVGYEDESRSPSTAGWDSMKEAMKQARGRPLAVRQGGSLVISLADFQVGKTDLLGGTPELLERSELALAEVTAEVKRLRPRQIVIVDAGDSTEGFESAPNANRTNDLQQTEQIRVWRRILWRWIQTMARLTEDLVVIGVPSNHCRVRSGKNALGPALDDWGIEVISQVADIAAGNPEAFGHVRFVVPEEHHEYVLFTLADGKVLGVVHGHQKAKPDLLPEYVKANSRRGLGQADVVICGHFHHLRVIAFGDDQYLIVSPTMDGGSSWFDGSGERSRPGVLSVVIDPYWDKAVSKHVNAGDQQSDEVHDVLPLHLSLIAKIGLHFLELRHDVAVVGLVLVQDVAQRIQVAV